MGLSICRSLFILIRLDFVSLEMRKNHLLWWMRGKANSRFWIKNSGGHFKRLQFQLSGLKSTRKAFKALQDLESKFLGGSTPFIEHTKQFIGRQISRKESEKQFVVWPGDLLSVGRSADGPKMEHTVASGRTAERREMKIIFHLQMTR